MLVLSQAVAYLAPSESLSLFTLYFSQYYLHYSLHSDMSVHSDPSLSLLLPSNKLSPSSCVDSMPEEKNHKYLLFLITDTNLAKEWRYSLRNEGISQHSYNYEPMLIYFRCDNGDFLEVRDGSSFHSPLVGR